MGCGGLSSLSSPSQSISPRNEQVRPNHSVDIRQLDDNLLDDCIDTVTRSKTFENISPTPPHSRATIAMSSRSSVTETCSRPSRRASMVENIKATASRVSARKSSIKIDDGLSAGEKQAARRSASIDTRTLAEVWSLR
ncbi:Hypothetical predicted protein [Lecanosticta acicola]|uniref:Uncharacterized protein n=1 Tax=Lecanosticta acicola TaxID=111012 RepID=A0AAI9E7J1_9PEZI|nr:Hypothetical predicted protein [Lecanosticta acicola]